MMDVTVELTVRGEALFGKVQAGSAQLQYTRAEAGSGTTERTALVLAAGKQTLALGSVRWTGETAILPVSLLSEQAEQDYTLTEMGIYAMDPEEGEILYKICRMGTPVQIRAGAKESIYFRVKDTLGKTANVTVDGDGGYLTEGGLRELQGVPNGFAPLDENGVVPVGNLPAFAPPYTYGTEDLEEGVTPLEAGRLHFVYSDL